MRTKVWLLGMQMALLLTLLVSCKKTDEPATPSTPPSAVGNWTITALTFDPAWARSTGSGTVNVPDFCSVPENKGETCLTDVTLTFGTNGSVSTNAAGKASCATAVDSKALLDFLFEPEGSFTETDTQLVLYGKGKLTALTTTKSGAGNVMNIQFQEDVDFNNRPVKTTYTLKLQRQ